MNGAFVLIHPMTSSPTDPATIADAEEAMTSVSGVVVGIVVCVVDGVMVCGVPVVVVVVVVVAVCT